MIGEVLTKLENIFLDNKINTHGNSLLLNSLQFIKLVVCIEEEFDIEFEDEMLKLDSFQTIEEIAKYIVQRKTGALRG
jgi:phosphopantetheine attachment domain protein